MTELEDAERLAAQEIAEADAEIERIRQESEAISAQILALKAQIRELDSKRYESGDIIRQANNRKRKANNRVVEVQAQIRVEQENAKRLAELEAKAAELEILTENAKWRKGILVNGQEMKALPHQIHGAHFLAAAKRAILADSMGVGKTLTSIATLDMLNAKKVLIVCPGEIMTGFVKEISRWTERPPVVIGKQPKKLVRNILNMTKAANLDNFVFIINYESWSRDKALITELQGMCFDTVIIDEAHNIKETDTSAYQGVEKIVMAVNKCDICGRFGKQRCFTPGCQGILGRSVENVFCMTGTPILNRPAEIYSLLHLVAPNEFYSKGSFLRSYCQMDYDTGQYTFRPGGEASLAERLSGMYLRRTHKSAGIVLPKQDIIIHEIELDPALYPKQAEILGDLATHAAIQIEEGKAATMMSILALITRQRQAATWPGGIVLHEAILDEWGMPVFDEETGMPKTIDNPIGLKYQESVKIDRAVQLTKEFVEDEQRIVVFSQFRSVLEELETRLSSEGIRAVAFHGGTPSDVRERVKNNFDRSRAEEPQWDVVLCHYKTGGVGLNLTAATATIIMDEEWNPGKNEQAYDRTHRIGQTDETSVHILRLADSIDIWMEQLISQKSALVGGFHGANDQVKAIGDMFRRGAKV